MKQQVSLDLMEFVEKNILPRYAEFGRSHGLEHVTRVIRNAIQLVKITGADIDMVYVIAAYHDLGMSGPRAIHHITGGKILQADARLKRWFSSDQIKIMKEAVEDHRASASKAPRSIYGKIVSSADRNTSVEVTLKRCYSYNRRHFPELNESEIIEECRKFLLKKFGINGYARNKMYFEDKKYQEYLDDITDLASDRVKFVTEIIKVNK